MGCRPMGNASATDANPILVNMLEAIGASGPEVVVCEALVIGCAQLSTSQVAVQPSFSQS